MSQRDINILVKHFLTEPHRWYETDDGWFAGECWCRLCGGTGFRHIEKEKEKPVAHKETCPVSATKRLFLEQNGWREVPSDGAGTCWLAPVGNAIYLSLDDAYALETTGGGVHTLLAEQALSEALRAEDVDRMEAAEAARYAETGVRLGIPPNY